SCSEKDLSDLTSNSLIPKPRLVTADSSYFNFDSKTYILVPKENDELMRIGRYLLSELSFYPGLDLELRSRKKYLGSSLIEFILIEDETIPDKEGYSLIIDKRKITISAIQPAGIFRGVQTLRQLLIQNGESIISARKSWRIPTGSIKDYPEYEYRGTMLDVARHFFCVEDVKRYIDLISLYKLNVLHLHLSDDQGWRIEIKSWPKLTEIGGSTQVGGGGGGFYTQEEYIDLVKYASERYIAIIPEIDMPGHTNAALASYAELNCNKKATKLYEGTKVGFSTLCTGDELTYEFIDDMIGELASLTPGPYIHIGGDESHVTALEDYVPFINRVQEIVKSHGKIMIGWDEITHANLESESIVQYWGSADNAKRAVSQGVKIILSPAKKCYLDMQYDTNSPLGLHWAGYNEVDSAYAWHPETLLPGISRDDILGIESPLWSETIQTLDDIEYMAFPRLIGHAEIGWAAIEPPDWEEYSLRLGKHSKLLDLLEVDFYRSPLVDWE
ncbi:MAG: family 20 glycosylhydrolase, partial [Bacteroidota bacterium]|nr:family 20 glycosylhydrolase [Bacteroidota bacterium]